MFLSFLNKEITPTKLLRIAVLVSYIIFCCIFFIGDKNIIEAALKALFAVFLCAAIIPQFLLIFGVGRGISSFPFDANMPQGLMGSLLIVLIIVAIWFLLRFGLIKRNQWHGKGLVILSVILWEALGVYGLSFMSA